MFGMPLTHSHMRESGRMFLQAGIVTLVLAISLSGCSDSFWTLEGFDGDWELELINGYYIAEVNSNHITIMREYIAGTPGSSTVIPHYYVTAYQLHEPYICLEGIKTEDWANVSEEELEARELSYYLVDTTSGEVVNEGQGSDQVSGPFDSYEEFKEHCKSLHIEIEDDAWIQPSDPDAWGSSSASGE